MKNKDRIFCLIFSLYFSLYAISPLSCSYSRQVDEHGDVAVTGIRLFVVELLLSNFIQHKDEDKTGHSTNLLLKKKRAALSLNKLHIFGKILKDIYAAPQSSELSGKLPVAAVQTDVPGMSMNYYYYLSYSGLSPPSA